MREGGAPPADILDLSRAALDAQMAVWKEPRFRAQQIWQWLYARLADDYAQMSNLPQALRDRLSRLYRISPLDAESEQISDDGLTRKVLFRLPDGETIESVLMSYERRQTVCVSSQVGCPIGCPFCATGQSGYVRNLSPAEIIAQPLFFARQLDPLGQPVSNVVIMGMGEPLINYDAVMQAVETWNDHQGLNLGARKITLSTAGYVPGIRRLAEEPLQIGLAVSLHAADDALRDGLVPLNRQYPLTELMSACRDYVQLTHRRVTFEYALIDGVNDTLAHASQLAQLLRGLRCHVNLIPINPAPDTGYRAPSSDRVRAFEHTLAEQQTVTTVRLGRGIDIQAGCGQLRQRQEKS